MNDLDNGRKVSTTYLATELSNLLRLLQRLEARAGEIEEAMAEARGALRTLEEERVCATLQVQGAKNMIEEIEEAIHEGTIRAVNAGHFY